MNDVFFSTETPEWSTPQPFFDALDGEFHFDLDPCATAENAKCSRFYTVDDDGLSREWAGTVFMNPPYGYRIQHWIRKAYESAQAGATVVCLIPAKTETRWWHDYCMKAKEIRFVKGRIKFGGSKVNAPFSSCVVVFTAGDHHPVFTTMDRMEAKDEDGV